jgi:hypothetical protein
LLDKQQIKLLGRASDTVPSDKRQAQAMTTKNTIFAVIQNKEDACCVMLWPGHSNFKLSQKAQK